MTHPLKTEAAEALARVQQARATAQSELDAANAALAEHPSSTDALAAVSAASRKVADTLDQLSHLQGAQEHAARVEAAAELVERRKQRRAKRERIAVLQSAMDDAAEALVAHTLALGPLLEQWASVGAEHEALCLSFAHEAEHDLSFGRQRIREGLAGCTNPTRGPLNETFVAALWLAGLGRVGPELSTCGIEMHYAGSPEDRANPISTYHERMRAVRQQVQGLLDRAEARIAADEAKL